MKARQPSVPLTQEDWEIWWFVTRSWILPQRRQSDYLFSLEEWARGSDRRDADRMLRIMVWGCRFCGTSSMHGQVHDRDCIYVTDPSSRRVWLRKGARVIE